MIKKFLFIFIGSIFFLWRSVWAGLNERDSLALSLAKADHDTLKIHYLSKLANSYINDDMEVCMNYAHEMIQLIDKLSTDKQKAAWYADAAIIYLNCNIYDEALSLLYKALKIFEDAGDYYSMVITKNTMGGVFFRLGKLEQALQYFQEGLVLSEKQIDAGNDAYKKILHIFYNNIGLIYNVQEDKKILTATYLEKAVETVNPKDYYNLGQYYNNLANCYYNQGKTKEAFQCAFKSMEYRKKIGHEDGIARTCYTIAALYYGEKDIAHSTLYLDSALHIGLKLKSNLLLRDVYNLYIALAEQKEDFRMANTYLRKVNEIENLLVNDTILARTTALKMEYDFEKKAALQELEVQNARFRMNLTFYILIMLAIILLLLYFLIRNRHKRIRLEKDNLEKDLEVRNKELTTNVMYLMRNTDMIREVIQRLVLLRPNLKTENAEVIKNIILDLQSLMKDDLWNEFEAHFNRVHLDFYKKLKELCPELSPTELKLCAFLRLNMSSKEISSISGITVKSVEVMRARLRKKLSISNTDINLVTYLSEF